MVEFKVVHATFESSGAPVNQLDIPSAFDVANCCHHVLWHNIPLEQQCHRHLLVARIALLVDAILFEQVTHDVTQGFCGVFQVHSGREVDVQFVDFRLGNHCGRYLVL